MQAYDLAPLDTQSRPTNEITKIVHDADIVISSTLRRALDSAKVLGTKHERNALFNEAGIPDPTIPFFKLRPKKWLMILRILMLLGRGKKDLSLKASKHQANNAAEYLIELSTEHNSIVVIGHGGMNWLIQKVLQKEGWELKSKPSHNYFGVTRLTKDGEAHLTTQTSRIKNR